MNGEGVNLPPLTMPGRQGESDRARKWHPDGKEGGRKMLHKRFVSRVRSGSSDDPIQALSGRDHVNAKEGSGMTALMEASFRNRLKTVRLLLENGADMEAVENSLGCNALTFACLSGRSGVVRILLDYGGNVNAQDRFSRTALMAAAATGNIGAVLLLLANGADAHFESKFGTTASDLAAIEGHTEILALLLPPERSTRIVDRRET